MNFLKVCFVKHGDEAVFSICVNSRPTSEGLVPGWTYRVEQLLQEVSVPWIMGIGPCLLPTLR